MSEDLSAVDDAQLARWAYGRAETSFEADRAQRAAQELRRRAEQIALGHAARLDTVANPIVHNESAAGSDDKDREIGGPVRPTRWRLMLAAAAVGALVVGGAVALPRLLDPGPTAPSSLSVFDRPPSGTERMLLAALQNAGQVVNVSPRVVGMIEYGTILAYLSIVREQDQPERDMVCLAVSEFERQAQADAISDWRCLERVAFEVEGFSTTLLGRGGEYDVEWGPTGGAQLDVRITEAQRVAMEPGFEAVFVDQPASELDQLYVADQGWLEQTGLVVEQLRTLYSVEFLIATSESVPSDSPAPDSTPRDSATSDSAASDSAASDSAASGEWVAAYTAAAIDRTNRQACLAIIDAGVQRESTCVLFDELGSRGIVLEVDRGGTRIMATWSSTGGVSVMTVRT